MAIRVSPNRKHRATLTGQSHGDELLNRRHFDDIQHPIHRRAASG
jgi:hypothetical protein